MLKEQKDEVSISGDDVREGLVAVIQRAPATTTV